jgi:hypothetical protein
MAGLSDSRRRQQQHEVAMRAAEGAVRQGMARETPSLPMHMRFVEAFDAQTYHGMVTQARYAA